MLLLVGRLVNYFFRNVFQNVFIYGFVIQFSLFVVYLRNHRNLFVASDRLFCRLFEGFRGNGAYFYGLGLFFGATSHKKSTDQRKNNLFHKEFYTKFVRTVINHRTDWNSPNDCFAMIASFQWDGFSGISVYNE